MVHNSSLDRIIPYAQVIVVKTAEFLLSALPRLRRYARILTNDTDRADDMVKETLTRARQIGQEPRSDGSPLVPLLSILRSVYFDQYAPGRPRGPESFFHARQSNPLEGADSIGSASEPNAQRANDLLAQLWRLPVEDREVLVLVAVERMSYEDIAALLAVPLATVLARLTQARASLRSGASETLTAPKNVG
jgi:RNA polymerase sigma-70 factor (ECF subfamily)